MTKANLANSEDDFNFRFNTKFNMMTIFSKLILVSLLISSVYPYTLEATIEAEDDHLDDILGEEVNEMDYSNIEVASGAIVPSKCGELAFRVVKKVR